MSEKKLALAYDEEEEFSVEEFKDSRAIVENGVQSAGSKAGCQLRLSQKGGIHF